MPHLQLSLLGGYQASLDDEPAPFPSNQVRALLAYLAVEARPHERAWLASLLWPDEPDAKARRNLRQVLLYLRQAIADQVADPPFLLISRQAIQFNRESNHSLDVRHFVLASYRARGERTADLEQVLTLYRGPFMPGFNLPGCPAFEQWLLFKRNELERQALTAMHILADHYLEARQFYKAEHYARQQLALDELREEAHRQLMLALAGQGEGAAALAQYEICCRILAEELDVEPDMVTLSVYRHIRASGAEQEESSSPVALLPRHNLPRQYETFIGRSEEMAELQQRLNQPHCALVTVLGPGGAGKTRVALETARARLEHYPDGVWFVELADVDTAAQMTTAVAHTLGLQTWSSADLTGQIIHHLQGKKMLLVLDNFEQLIHEVQWLVHLIQALPGVQFLVTSRIALNVRAEWLYEIVGLPYPPADVTIVDESIYTAVSLFHERARQRRHDFAASAAEQAAVYRICRLVEGLPLALELAASLVRVASCSQIAQVIQTNLDELAVAARDLPPRQRSLRAVFDYSWALLDQFKRPSLARISVFRDGFTAEASLKVAEASTICLTALSDRSFIHQPAPGRYMIHELLRRFATEKLAEFEDDPQRLTRQHSSYFLHYVAQRETILGGLGSRQATADIQRELENVRAAWEHAAAMGCHALLDGSLMALFNFCRLSGLWQEGVHLCQQAITSLQNQLGDDPNTPATLARLYICQATLYCWLGDYEQAAPSAQQGITCARQVEETTGIAAGHLALASALHGQGKYETAVPHLEQALQLAQTIPSLAIMADTLRQLGVINMLHAEYGRAQSRLLPALSIYQKSGNRVDEGQTLSVLGNIAFYQGDYDQAESCYQQALAIQRETGDQNIKGGLLLDLGSVASRRGDYAAWAEYCRQALSIHQKTGNLRGQNLALGELAQLGYQTGQYDTAVQTNQEILARQQRQGDLSGEARTLGRLGDIALATGDFSGALDCFHQQLHIVRALNLRHHESICLLSTGLAWKLHGQFDPARACYQEAFAASRELGNKPVEAQLLCLLSTLEYQEGNLDGACDWGRQACRLARAIKDADILAAALACLGAALSSAAQWQEAQSAYHQACAIRQNLGQAHELPPLWAGLAEVALFQNDLPQALTYVERVLAVLDTVPLNWRHDPLKTYLISCRVLQRGQDGRAAPLLQRACTLLETQAGRLADGALQQSFLAVIPTHRELAALGPCTPLV